MTPEEPTTTLSQDERDLVIMVELWRAPFISTMGMHDLRVGDDVTAASSLSLPAAVEYAHELSDIVRRLDADLLAARRALGLSAIPLETLRMVEMDNYWMSPALKQSILDALAAIHTALKVESVLTPATGSQEEHR